MLCASDPLAMVGDYLWSPGDGSLVLVGPDKALRDRVAAICRAVLVAYGWTVLDATGPRHAERHVVFCDGSEVPPPGALVLASLDRQTAASDCWQEVCRRAALVLDCRDGQVMAVSV